MIIGTHNDVYHVDQFIDGLKMAVRGLVRVTTEPGHDYTVCSGWVLTDTLVVIPAYAAFVGTAFFCYGYQAGNEVSEPVPATLISSLPENREDNKPALLKLSKPLPGCALTLETRSCTPGDVVVVLQHFEGGDPAQFSIGTITGVEPGWINYNASTSVGSGGGPVIDVRSWKIVGMHMSSLRDEKQNRGIRIDPMLDALRETSAWLEIVKHHNLAESAYTLTEDLSVMKPLRLAKRRTATSIAESAGENKYLLRAALSWTFDPEKVSEEERKQLQPLVVDSNALSWTLKNNERERILRTAGSAENMVEELPEEATDETGQAVIKNILKGVPYNLDNTSEEELSYWLQAVHWFDKIIPELPSAAEVNRTIERKRTRGQLQNVIRGFRGRKIELKQLVDWYNDAEAGPMLITGIGGMGKSALVGYFANNLPADTLLLWLDFDRPDLAPDDAVSVLNAIAKQVSAQLSGFEAPVMEEANWKEGAKQLGSRLAKATKKTQSPLIILDGFEVAQHTKEYQEIWQVLEAILTEAPPLKVIVSGRAPVKSLKLQGKEATHRKLEGLVKEDAEAWLRERNINDDEVLKIVLKLAEGIPLRLKLAVRLIDSGEKVKDLPEKLPQEYITGYLYQRILYRVIDPVLIPIVEDILVLRKCSKPMLVKILGENVPEGLTAEEVYDRLSREMALVGDAENLYGSFVVAGSNSDRLELRPEVRSATLRLLEHKDAAKVRAMDEKAVNWYWDQDVADISNAAELVYHLLRLKRLDEARKIFRIDCVPLLQDAINDLPEDANDERIWLEKKVGSGSDGVTNNLLSTEISIAIDIKNRFSRGMITELDEILGVIKKRSTESPLLIFDAFNCWKKGELQNAISILKYADQTIPTVQKDRDILHAFLLSQAGDWEGADELLETLEDGSFWAGMTDQTLLLMMVTAARIRLMVDIEAEIKLFKALQNKYGTDAAIVSLLRQFLTPSDIVMPLLNYSFAERVTFESFSSGLKVPVTELELPDFRQEMQKERFRTSPFAISLEDNVTAYTNGIWRGKVIFLKNKGLSDELFNIASELAYKGYRRWKLATSKPILGDLCKLVVNKREMSPVIYVALGAILVAFRGQQMQFQSFSNIDKLMLEVSSKATDAPRPRPPSAGDIELLHQYMVWNGIAVDKDSKTGKIEYRLPPHITGQSEISSFILFMTAPSPLELLCKNILGLPENYKLIP
jgi:hypothetical protein